MIDDVALITIVIAVGSCLEILAHFVLLKKKNPRSGSTIIFIFLTFFSTHLILYINFFLIDLYDHMEYVVSTLSSINLLVVNIQAILNAVLIKRDRGSIFKIRGILPNVLVVGFGILATVQAISIAAGFGPNGVTLSFGAISFLSNGIVILTLQARIIKGGFLQRKNFLHLELIGIVVVLSIDVLQSNATNMILGSSNESFILEPWALAILISGSMLTCLAGFMFTPMVEQVYWVQNVVAFFIADRNTRTVLFKRRFGDTGTLTEQEAQLLHEGKHGLVLQGIESMRALMLDSVNSISKTIEVTGLGSLHVVLVSERGLLFFMIVRKQADMIKEKLISMKDLFFNYFSDLIDERKLDPAHFAPFQGVLESSKHLGGR